MKKTLALLFAAIFACAAQAAEVKTDALTVDVPVGWESSVGAEDVMLKTPSGTVVTLAAQRAVTEQEKKNLDPKAIAEYLSQQLRESGASATAVTERNGVSSFRVSGRDEETGAETQSEFRFSIQKDTWFVMVTIQSQNQKDVADALAVERLLRAVRYH